MFLLNKRGFIYKTVIFDLKKSKNEKNIIPIVFTICVHFLWAV